MRRRYGAKVIKELEKMDAQAKQFTVQELKNLTNKYKEKLSILS